MEKIDICDEIVAKIVNEAIIKIKERGSFVGKEDVEVTIPWDYDCELTDYMIARISQDYLIKGGSVSFNGTEITAIFRYVKVRGIDDFCGRRLFSSPYNPDIWEDDVIVDENKSVKWNLEQVKLHNEKEMELFEEFHRQLIAADKVYKQNVYQAIMRKMQCDIHTAGELYDDVVQVYKKSYAFYSWNCDMKAKEIRIEGKNKKNFYEHYIEKTGIYTMYHYSMVECELTNFIRLLR